MEVVIDPASGFCFGVVQAIDAAEKALTRGKVYSLGDIVHNKVEVQRLGALGLEPLRHELLDGVGCGATVLIRAHGEPPSVYKTARSRGLNIIDATCPVVARLQKIVRKAHARMKERGGQVVILGKKGHAEVVGLTGQADGDVTVVEKVADLEAVDFKKPVYLLSQTTQSLALFEKIKEEIFARALDPAEVTVHDTICRQVANREPHLGEFSRRFDAVVFVSGRKSSNGRVLYGVCLESNPRTYLVEDVEDLRDEWFEGVSTVGICGATSTPRWLMEKVARAIRGDMNCNQHP
ncbi:MAG: 4-hydroxy-3-methylbut-2-enyl diphosphate reductase [Rikenellaceae bacterium]|nr:4-hydroxy-3-methylbut-2-enyl diphosphate reductase [Rikenellaceae bacterium]